MSRIGKCFDQLGERDRKALIVYVTAGDPLNRVTVPLMHEMVRSGADIIELGVPFSDPEAEGPVIQAACERALDHGTSLAGVIEMVSDFRQEDADTPVILMGYLNPMEVMGYARFAELAATAGVDGTITVNLPPEEGEALSSELASRGIDSILLLAPTTTPERARMISAASSGFVYYVSLKGVTGAASLDVNDVAAKVGEFRFLGDLPIAVGFGIRDGESAAAVAELADGVVVGSALVEIVARYSDQPEQIATEVGRLVANIRQAIDNRG